MPIKVLLYFKLQRCGRNYCHGL